MMREFHLRERVKVRGVEGIISSIFLDQDDNTRFVVRDDYKRSLYAERHELELTKVSDDN